MSLNDCEKDLARLIHVIVEQGNYIEEARIELAKNVNFSPFAAFRIINASATGFLTQDDLEHFLRQNGFVLQPEALDQFFTLEKDKSYRITYNDFLNQVLPSTDIDLRNSCLERPHRAVEGNTAEVDHLITAVYQKANEYTRTLEAAKKKLSSVNNQLLEKVFQYLADDVTGNLSFKSISAFMKQNNFTFEKKDYERFMNKIDRNLTGRITPIDFKYLMFPHGTLANNTRDHGLTHRKAESIFSGISPIKNWNSSPYKGSTRKPLEASLLGENERSLLALKNKSNAHSPHDKIQREQDRKSHVGSTFNPSAMKSGHKQGSAPDTRAVLYNKEIAAINDHIVLQNAPETTYQDRNSKNPLEWRYLDPVYHNYWSYHRDHNRTLSPDYFSRADGRTLSQKHRSHNPARPGTNFVPFFNPTFVDPGTYENLERYPDNPFRYTDHGHFFKNYYANLRHNYYDQYYNHVPYKTKISSDKSEINSRNSPQKSRPQSQKNSPQRYQPYPDLANYEINEQRPTNSLRRNPQITIENAVPSSLPLVQHPQQSRELPGRFTRDALVNQESQPVNNAPYQFVYVSGPEDQQDNEPKSSIRLEKQSFVISPKLNQDPLSSYALGRPGGQIAEDFNNKPYTFVVANK